MSQETGYRNTLFTVTFHSFTYVCRLLIWYIPITGESVHHHENLLSNKSMS